MNRLAIPPTPAGRRAGRRRRCWRRAGAGLLSALLQIAPGAPPEAHGQQRRLEAVDLDAADVIGWRQLTRADFRGERPPDAFARPSVRPVAVSCAFLVPDPAARIFAVPRTVDDVVRYRARVEGLRFRAQLSRTCSWWNPNADMSPAYVLQHEQIHFDIFETAARRLNKDLPGLLSVMDVEATDAHGAVVGAQAYVEGLLRRALDETAKRSFEFDRETSFGFELARQGAWRTRMDQDLEELRAFAAEPDTAAPPRPAR